MKKTIFLFLLFLCNYSYAQINLVHNPSFEDYYTCPHTLSLTADAKYWSAIVDTSYTADTALVYHGTMGTITHLDGNCLPYYCNACDNDSLDPSHFVTVPSGSYYYHYPRSGNGMMMAIMFEQLSGVEGRMYLQGRLFHHLTAGQTYCVSFYVVNTHYGADGCNHIGAYFDDGTIDTTHECGHPRPEYIPQVVSDSIIADTTNWTKIEGSFTATGTEQFLTIGNFSDNAHTSILAFNSAGAALHAYYLVDDVSVIATDATANAGVDRATTTDATDSVQIGDTTGYLPCYWYANGVLIDSNTAGFKVHPSVTTHYVMELDVCGHITYDTATVYVWTTGMNNYGILAAINIYPNPAKDNFTIEGALGCEVRIYNVVGQIVTVSPCCNGERTCRGSARLTMTSTLTTTNRHTITTNKEMIDISGLSKGVYIIEILEPETA